jgi:predicted regulator of Ras-like GTPase activity (Roadblock/LC7/MglB family)
MESIPVLTIEDVANIDGILQEYLQKSESDLAVIVDKGGNVISQCGDLQVMDVTIIAALAAGSFAATKELARRIGEEEFTMLFHQGNDSHIFMNSVDDDTIMITVFGSQQTTMGLVRYFSGSACQSMATLLSSLRNRQNNHGFQFDSADIAAAGLAEKH